MKPYEKCRPNLEREWLKKKIQVWKKFVEQQVASAKKRGLIDNDFDIKTVDKEILIEMGIADSTGKASVGSISDDGSDLGDVDFLQFSDEEEDEYAHLKGKNLLDGYKSNKNEDARIERRQQGWFNKILSHTVKDKEEMVQRKKKYTDLSEKVKKDNTKDSTLNF